MLSCWHARLIANLSTGLAAGAARSKISDPDNAIARDR